jgi:hypothetical protein
MTKARRTTAIAAILVVAVSLFASIAYATTVRYAGPKTWLPGWDQDSAFDNSSSRWVFNMMCDKSLNVEARVVFIKTDGGWTYAHTDQEVCTSTSIPPGHDPNYTKKAYCKNNSLETYTAYCEADRF